METAKTILNQLGGNRFIAMTGAQCYSDKNKLIVKFKGSKISNYVSITLNGSDLYDVEFKKLRGMDFKTIATFNDIYCDMLTNIFEQTTKLYTRI